MAIAAQPPYWGVVLKNGSVGPDVSLVQRWLNGVRGRWPGIPRLTVDGRFGSNTAEAVKLFQLANGLAADGAVGPATWNALSGEYQAQQGAGEIYPGTTLRSGTRGSAVKSAQQRLRSTVPGLAADGRYGDKTKAAVTAYQTLHGLAADGVIGPATWAHLYGTG